MASLEMGMKARDLRQANVSRRPWHPSDSLGAIPMSDAPVYVGLDYHTASVRVCILDRDGTVLANRPCKNDWQAITAVVAAHSTKPRAAIEACTGSADL